jgi:signal transduction histidine kinase
MALGLLLGGAAAAWAEPVQVLASAERRIGDAAAEAVTLPDRVPAPPDAAAPLQVLYRWQLSLPARSAPALYFPGLRNWARITLNGQVVHDSSALPLASPPRGADRLLLVPVPPGLWQPGANTVELLARGEHAVSVPPLEFGPAAELAQRRRWRAFATTQGPALVAAVVGTLGLSMLFLGWRRREGLYGYFGLGLAGWALHTAWTVAPVALMTPLHYEIWWNTLYGAFVACLVLFCLRFADWHWRAFERLVLASVALAPLLMYALLLADPESEVTEYWRLGLIGLVAIAVLALLRVARRSAQRDKLLISAVGAAALGASLHDWWLATQGRDNHPIYLVPYVGLLFAAFIMRILIDRFLHATRELERMNAELGQRVAAQNAELRQTLEQMRQARDAAEAADQAKTRFLAAASHDLRQPAHALGLYMATLRAGSLNPEQAELAQRMGASLAALDAMFAELLDVSRMDAGAVVPHWDVVALAPLLRRLADEWAGEAEARGLRLSLRVADAAAMTVSDALLLERVLRNLLANAVKYTKTGGVLLACRSRSTADGGRAWRIEVWDSGIGIAPADQERVFEEFFQVGNPGRDRASGLGLGLAIVRRLARLLQLRLVLHSRPGRGSVFFVEGLAPAGQLPRQAAAARREMRRLAGSLVAVIEDDAEVRDAMARLLRLWECQVVEGSSAAEVLQALAERGPAQAAVAAIVADVRLAQGQRGPDEAKLLFATWGRQVPLLLVSGETAPEHLRQLQDAGHTCLAKPVSPARLRAWLEQVLPATERTPMETR